MPITKLPTIKINKNMLEPKLPTEMKKPTRKISKSKPKVSITLPSIAVKGLELPPDPLNLLSHPPPFFILPIFVLS